MNTKIRLLVVFLSLGFIVGSLSLFGNPQDSAKSGNVPTVEIVEGEHPFYDAQILAEAFTDKEVKIEINGKEKTAQIIKEGKIVIVLKVLSKYVKNPKLKELHETLIEQLQQLQNEREELIKQDQKTRKELEKELKDKLEELGKRLKELDTKHQSETNQLQEKHISKMNFEEYKNLIEKEQGFKNAFLEKYINGLKKRFDDLISELKKYKDKKKEFEEKKVGQPPEFKGLQLQKSFTPKEISPAKGFPSPVMVVDALGSFLAKRFKEELTIRYLKKFRDELDKYELRELFPSTTDFLVSSDIFDFKSLMPTLKTTFQIDLNNIDSNISKYLVKKREDLVKEIEAEKENVSDSEKNKLEKKKKLLNIVLFFWDIFAGVKRGNHPIGVIGNINNLEFIENIDDKEMDVIRLGVWIVRSLSNKEGDGLIWEDSKVFLDFLTKDKNIKDLYKGLFYAGIMKDLKNESLKKTIKDKLNDLTIIENYVDGAIKIAKGIKDQIGKMKEKKEKGDKITFQDYHSYLQTIYEKLKDGYCLIVAGKDCSSLDANVKKKIKKIEMYLGYVDKFFEISWLIHKKQYMVAFLGMLKFLDEKVIARDSKIKKGIVKYISFLNNMVIAQNTKEMQEVLEAAALPVGSYRIKRAGRFNISLNAYVGGFLGKERLGASEEDIIDKEKERFNAGLAAPIGLAFSWGKSKGNRDKPGPSFSIFASAIDIGAVVNWRLSGEDKGLPEFTWKNVLAPGLFFIYGIKNSPISIGAGIQYGPQLREIKAKEAVMATAANAVNGTGTTDNIEAVINSSSFRFGIIIAIDIPIFNIYNRENSGGRL